MKSSTGRWLAQLGQGGLWLCLLTGCAHVPPAAEANRTPTVARAEMSELYRVSCPDVVEVTLPGGQVIREKIDIDGRIDLGGPGRVRIEGLTRPEIERRVAEADSVSPTEVHVRVAEYVSQEIYIFGEVNGLQRAMPYRGEETVSELLQRMGGLGEGAEPNDVYVVRAHVADGGRPEVFPIALGPGSKERARLKLQPFDQVYIGETRRSSLCKSLPPCLRALFESLGSGKSEDSLLHSPTPKQGP
jgi:protein involved in polysaccharide export with SLBB domain